MRNRGSVCRDQPVSRLIQLEPGSVYTVLNVLLPCWWCSCSMGCSRQEYQSGSSFLLQGVFPTQGSNLRLLHYRQVVTTEPPRKPRPWLDLILLFHFRTDVREEGAGTFPRAPDSPCSAAGC